MGCTKTLNIKSASTAIPFAYYKLDNELFNGFGDTTEDSMPLGLDTNNTNATATLVSGKITQAWRWTGSTGCIGAPGAYFKFENTSFLIRFWARVIGTEASWAFKIWNIVEDGPSNYRLQVYPFSNGTFQIRMYSTSTSQNMLSTDALDSTWKRVVFWYNQTANEMHLRINEGVTDTLALSGPIGAGAARFDLAGISILQCELCELGFWKGTNAEWSAADFTDDWNGGAGKTYP